MGEAIVVTSGKGGVGKTSTTANVGVALAMMGQHVCLMDADIGLRNLDVVMGLDNRVLYDVVDVVMGKCSIEQALVKDKRVDQLYMMAAAQVKGKMIETADTMKAAVDEVKRSFDIVLIDSPAGIEHGFQVAIAGADRAIVVTTPERAAVQDADRVIGILEGEHFPPAKLIINRVRQHMVNQGNMLDVDQVMSVLGLDLLGMVPDDENVIAHGNRGEPLVLRTDVAASQAYRNIARRMMGEPVPLMRMGSGKKKHWWSMK